MTADTVLVVSASYDAGAAYVINALHRRGTPSFRLNTDKFPSRVRARFLPSTGLTFQDGSHSISGNQIKSVWYRRHVAPDLPSELDPNLREFCERETRSFLDGTLAVLQTNRWLSPPQAIARAERKPYQLAIANNLGFAVPKTVITNDQQAVRELARKHRLVAKAVSSGYIASNDATKAIFTSALAPEDLEDLSGLTVGPVIFQELVEKVSDIRVTVVAKEVFTAEILSQKRESSRIDWRATDDPNLEHRVHRLPMKTEDLCRKLVAILGLVFGAIDLALKPDGTYIFFEINPNGEWLWLEDRLGFPISETIAQWLD